MHPVASPVGSNESPHSLPPQRGDGDGDGGWTFASWAKRHNALLTIVSAGIAPVLYLLYLDRYAVNSFVDDDWSVVPLVHGALHGRLTLSLLWSQHNESRIVVGNVVDVLFGYADRLDVRAITFFSAVVFIASYIGLLALFRKYTSRPLTPIPVLVISVVWFSLADYQNALWAFQVSWYLTVFFFVMMLCALLLPEDRRPLWFTAAVFLALAASLSTVQGFLSWPVGAICLVWPAWSRRIVTPMTIWLGAMIVTVGVYVHGYTFSEGNTCFAPSQCTASFEMHHPQTVLEFFFALIGNVIPGQTNGVVPRIDDPARYVLVGVALFAVSVFILVQSWRARSGSERLPLPGLMILFALFFDLTIVVGRGGTGVVGAINFNRYLMANLILLAGIVVWALARLSAIRLPATRSRWHAVGSSVLFGALAIFLVVQVVESTSFGVTNGRNGSALRVEFARLFVNSSPTCVIMRSVPFYIHPEAVLRASAEDHLGEWGPTTYRHFRNLGPTSYDIGLAKSLTKRVTQITGTPPGPCFPPSAAASSR
jgi:hypothetical protein